jgi:hypothetical protein
LKGFEIVRNTAVQHYGGLPSLRQLAHAELFNRKRNWQAIRGAGPQCGVAADATTMLRKGPVRAFRMQRGISM